jgi:hypothetical protein
MQKLYKQSKATGFDSIDMLALVDMRLGDVYRRLGQLSKADRHYNAAHSVVTELPKYLAVASQTVSLL